MNSRRVRIGAAVLVAVLVVTLTSLGRSGAAFFDGTANSADSFTAGTGFDIGAFYTWGDTGDVQLVTGQVGTATWSTAAVGDRFGCGLQTDATLWCWGSNNIYGQLGVGDTGAHYLPQKVGTSTWTAVGTGTNHTCAVRSDQTLWCWGDGANGQLGQNDVTGRTAPAIASECRRAASTGPGSLGGNSPAHEFRLWPRGVAVRRATESIGTPRCGRSRHRTD